MACRHSRPKRRAALDEDKATRCLRIQPAPGRDSEKARDAAARPVRPSIGGVKNELSYVPIANQSECGARRLGHQHVAPAGEIGREEWFRSWECLKRLLNLRVHEPNATECLA